MTVSLPVFIIKPPFSFLNHLFYTKLMDSAVQKVLKKSGRVEIHEPEAVRSTDRYEVCVDVEEFKQNVFYPMKMGQRVYAHKGVVVWFKCSDCSKQLAITYERKELSEENSLLSYRPINWTFVPYVFGTVSAFKGNFLLCDICNGLGAKAKIRGILADKHVLTKGQIVQRLDWILQSSFHKDEHSPK